MSEDIRVTNSEGVVSVLEELSSSYLCTSFSTPWNLKYNCFSEGVAENENDDGSSQDFLEDPECTDPAVLSTSSVAKVPFRRKANSQPLEDKENQTTSPESPAKGECNKRGLNNISEKSKLIWKKSPKQLQTTRHPLRPLFDKTTATETPPQLTDSDDDMISPPASRSSSSTSIASISPVSPLKRYQRRLKEGETSDKQKTTATTTEKVELDLNVKYQQLLTKYFKAKKMIRKLKDQNKYDQRKISLMQFSCQHEAAGMQMTETTEDEENHENVSEDVNVDTATECDSVDKNALAVACIEQSNSSKENEENTSSQSNSSKPDPDLDAKDEWIKRMAAVINTETLRPIIFNVPRDSPPSRMNEVIEKLSKSGKCCESCGKRMARRGKIS